MNRPSDHNGTARKRSRDRYEYNNNQGGQNISSNYYRQQQQMDQYPPPPSSHFRQDNPYDYSYAERRDDRERDHWDRQPQSYQQQPYPYHHHDSPYDHRFVLYYKINM